MKPLGVLLVAVLAACVCRQGIGADLDSKAVVGALDGTELKPAASAQVIEEIGSKPGEPRAVQLKPAAAVADVVEPSQASPSASALKGQTKAIPAVSAVPVVNVEQLSSIDADMRVQSTPKTNKQIEVSEVWEAPVGSTLRIALEQWAKRNKWSVDWRQEDLDYEIKAPLKFVGSFESAVSSIFDLYAFAPRRFAWCGSRPQSKIIVVENKSKTKVGMCE